MKRCATHSLEIVKVTSQRYPAIVAIPARNEVDRIGHCLAALAMQRDRLGMPIERGRFGVLLLVNNSADGTAHAARQMESVLPYPLQILEVSLAQNATAGGARHRVMEEAAGRLREDGIIMTTDADSAVTPTWYAGNMRHLEAGADCVAGYIDAEPAEMVSHGSAFLARGRLEDTYLRLIAEIYAVCDPRPHDPWPNHRVSSGASLAVKLAAYRAVGGMPDKALGEDIAFRTLLDRSGLKVRHPLDVSVLTSCRLEGRASGGAADTMRHRRDVPDAACDDDLEPATTTLLRATMRGFLREADRRDQVENAGQRLLGSDRWSRTAATFAEIWEEIEARHPKLARRRPLHPSDLSRQIAIAKFIIRHLRLKTGRKDVPADRCLHGEPNGLVDAERWL